MPNIPQRDRELLARLNDTRRELDRLNAYITPGAAGTAGGGSVDAFLDLTDTPSSYSGAASRFVRVNGGGSALVFGTVDWADIYNVPVAGTATRGIAAFSPSNFSVADGTASIGTVPWAVLTGVPSTFAPSAHATSHKHSGSDEVGTATPTANAIPKADGSGLLDSWISVAGTATRGRAAFGSPDFVVNAGTVNMGTVWPHYSGVPTAGRYAYWTAAGTIADSGFGTADLPRYSGTPVANRLAYWTGAGTVTHGSIDYINSGGTPILRATSSAGMQLQSDGGDLALHVADNGWVGINTTTPGQDVVGTFDIPSSQTVLQVHGADPAIIVTGTAAASFHFIDQNAAADAKWFVMQNFSGVARFIAINDAATVQIQLLALDLATGKVGLGTASPAARLHVNQPSTTAAIPVLTLRQADLSEEFIRFSATVGAGNPIDTAALGSYYGKVRVYVEGVGAKWLALYD